MEDAPTYQEWKAANVARAENGTWVVEGDILMADEEQIRAMYLRYFARPPRLGDVSYRSIVQCWGQFDNVWSVSEKLDLTYCFGNFVTEGFEAQVRAQLEKATAVWERSGDVNFIEVPLSKAQCNCLFPADVDKHPDDCLTEGMTGQAKIRVRQLLKPDCTSIPCQPASANFPHNIDAENGVQEILFNDNDAKELPRHAIHELGHALGLVHEHARWTQTATKCQTGSVWRSVTDRDPYSVMGYGGCAGTAPIAYSEPFVSSLDRMGLAYLYNLPRTEFPSYTTTGVDDILWYQPERGKYVLWRAVVQQGNGAPIEFAEPIEFCPDGQNADDCAWGTPNRSRIKPFPVAMTAAHLADVIAYGPEGADDAALLHTPTGPLEFRQGSIPGSFDLPIVGRFLHDNASEEVWWVRPGENSDHLGTFGETYTVPLAPPTDFGAGISSDGWYLPLVGLWAQRGSRLPNSQVLWLREYSKQFLLSYQDTDHLHMQETIVKPPCLFFENVRQPIALRGDFDGDDFPEIFWVSLSNGRHVLWRDTARMWSPVDPQVDCSDPAIAAVVMEPVNPPEYKIDLTFVKPFVGDFDGDGSDDIFWYTPGSSTDVIWTKVGRLNDEGTAIVPHPVLPVVDGDATTIDDDYSPIVGDFNGDGCDDIFWFAPHTDFPDDPTGGATENVSPLWRANCSNDYFSGFAAESDVPAAPLDAYPVGYDPRTAGHYSELSLPAAGD